MNIKTRIAIIICVMMILLTGCSNSTRKVAIELGEIGKVNAECLIVKQDGLKTTEQQYDTLILRGAKDGTYHFSVKDDTGTDIEVIMIVQKDDISVKKEDGTDVSFTIRK